MKKLRILSLILALLMLVAVFAACTGDNDDNKTDDSEASDTTDDGLYHATYLPDVTYDGADFRVFTTNDYTSLYTVFDADADTDNKVLAALYKRNRIIEQEYDVVFDCTTTEDWAVLTSTLASYVSAQSDEYELNMMIQRDAFSYGVKGYVMRTDSLPYIDATQPWYVQDLNDALTVNGISFFAYSDECLNMFAQTNCVLFNANMIEDNELDNPYDLVDNGTWTIEKLYEMSETIAKDVNNDGTIDDYDVVGIASENDMLYPTLWIGAGLKTIEKNEDDYPEFTANGDEKLISFLGDMIDVYNEDGWMYDTSVWGTNQYSDGDERYQATQMFINGHALFRTTITGNISTLNEMEDDFGIVPAPKYDESQEGYHSRVIDGWINIVPATNGHLEMTSVILEALAVESKNYVYDAFYYESLQDRYTRDDKAIEMLDLISATRTIDFGDTVWQSDIRYKIIGIIHSGTNTLASKFSSIKESVQFTIDNALEDLADQ